MPGNLPVFLKTCTCSISMPLFNFFDLLGSLSWIPLDHSIWFSLMHLRLLPSFISGLDQPNEDCEHRSSQGLLKVLHVTFRFGASVVSVRLAILFVLYWNWEPDSA